MIKVAINGFGRIGRLALREILTGTDFDIVAINGTSSPEDCAYLFKYDSTFRTFHPEMISYDENNPDNSPDVGSVVIKGNNLNIINILFIIAPY